MEKLSHRKSISAVLERRVRSYQLLAQAVVTDSSVDTVHDFRVASRRLLTAHRLLLKVSADKQWRKTIRSGARALNQMRDLQVMSQNIGLTQPLLRLLQAQIKAEKLNWCRFCGEVDNDTLFRALDSSCHEFESFCQQQPDKAVLLLEDYWIKSFRQVNNRLKAVKHEELTSLHRLRVKFKALRYLLELLLDADVVTRVDIAPFKHWQNLFGELSDADFAIKWLEYYAPDSPRLTQIRRAAHQLSFDFFAQTKPFKRFIDKTDRQVIASF